MNNEQEKSEFIGEAHNEESRSGGFGRSGEVDAFFGSPTNGDSTGYVTPSEAYEVRTSKGSVEEGLRSSPASDNLIDVVRDGENSSPTGERDESTDHVDYDGFHSAAVSEVGKEEESVSKGSPLQSTDPMNSFFEEYRDKDDYIISHHESHVGSQESLKEVKLDSGDVSIGNDEMEKRNNCCEYLEDKVKNPPHEDDGIVDVVHDIEDVVRVSKKPEDEHEEFGGQECLSSSISNEDIATFCDGVASSSTNEKARASEEEEDDDWGDFSAAVIAEEERAKGEEEFGVFIDAPPGTTDMPDSQIAEHSTGEWNAIFCSVIDRVEYMQPDEEGALLSRATEMFSVIPLVRPPKKLSDIINKDEELNQSPFSCALGAIPPWTAAQSLNKWTVDLLLSCISPVSNTAEVEEKDTDLYGASLGSPKLNVNVSSSGSVESGRMDTLYRPSCIHGKESRIRVGYEGLEPPIGTTSFNPTLSLPERMMTTDDLPSSTTLPRKGSIS